MCAFSDGGRLLESHHSKLHFITVEFMLCTRNWVNDELKIGFLYKLFSAFNFFIWMCAIII
ncbi:hypothetical protein LINPERPRIM_LOCUS24998 [Linum perenne]